MKWQNSLLVGVCLLMLAALPALAQNPTGTLTGRVTSEGQALPGVTVTINSSSLQGTQTAVTTGNGDYIFRFLPPGEYEVTYELESFQTVKRTLKISAAVDSTLDVQLALAEVQEEILVTGSYETVSTTVQASTTHVKEFIEKLPIERDIRESVLLSPGVNDTGPNQNITISGGMSYENLFLVNGVVVNENIRGQAFTLFIEDAIEETTTSTSGVSAQYGRFAGGVVNVLTKSGGNEFHGSLRTSLTNQDWEASTPLTVSKTDQIDERYEATLGGRILRDRLWFFGAGRDFEQTQTRQTTITNIPFPVGTDQQRLEGKLTAAVTPSHRLVASGLTIEHDDLGNFFGSVMDLASVNDRSLPQDLRAFHYSGVVTEKFFLEGQFSEREFTFENSGSRFTDVIKGTLFVDRPTGRRWHSPTFCGVCLPEERNNENFLAKGSYFLSTQSAGTHDLVFGYDTFNDIRKADNHQSGSDFRILLSNTLVSGGNLFPVFSNTTIIQWNPILVSSRGTDLKTNSFFLNDTWRLSDRWSFNLGVRYDENDGVNSADEKVVDDNKVSPRVALTYDVRGNGDLLVSASFGRYVAAIANSQADATSQGGVPATFQWDYRGPDINTGGSLIPADNALQLLWNWFNSVGGTNNSSFLRAVSIPGGTVRIDQSLGSPHTDEMTLGVTKRLGNRGLVRADIVHREGADFYAQKLDLTTGRVITPSGLPADLAFIVNEDNLLRREYDGLHITGRYRARDRLNVGGNWTWSHARGNFDGETRASGPVRSGILQFPEYRDVAWNAPQGDLGIDRRHNVRAWAVWDAISTEHNNLSISVLQNFWTGLPFDAAGAVDTRPVVTNPGYVRPPATATYFFSGRGAFRTPDVTRTDLAANYSFYWNALGKRLEVFIQPEVLNIFNEDEIFSTDVNVFNTTVFDATNSGATSCNGARCRTFNPFTETPVEGVHWAKGPDFGKVTDPTGFQQPRTFRLSVGFRF